jgi:hypothetical protein
MVAGMNTRRVVARVSAAFAALARTQKLAAATTALYRNQQVGSLPKLPASARPGTGKPLRGHTSVPVPGWSLLRLLVAE